MSPPYTYGSDPNNALTWDSDQVFGCFCSENFEGHNCNLKSCPKGDDVMTQHQKNEVQQLSCTTSDNTGSFQLIFRGQAVSVDADYTAAELETALNSLSTIEQVSVSYSDLSMLQVCQASGAIVNIEFIMPTGDVPEMSISNSVNIDGALAVTTTHDGTKEYTHCSGRGICDHTSGLCDCFPGFVSSDGQGNIGLRGDCGAKNPYDSST